MIPRPWYFWRKTTFRRFFVVASTPDRRSISGRRQQGSRGEVIFFSPFGLSLFAGRLSTSVSRRWLRAAGQDDRVISKARKLKPAQQPGFRVVS
jgi:hypothetical protein